MFTDCFLIIKKEYFNHLDSMVLSHQSRTKSMRTHLSLNVFFFFESFKIKIVIYVYTSYYTIKYDVSLYTDFICIKKLDLNNFTLYLYCFFTLYQPYQKNVINHRYIFFFFIYIYIQVHNQLMGIFLESKIIN